MKAYIRQNRSHIALICILFCIAGLLEAVIYFHYEKLLEEPLPLNRFLTIEPVYNENGSWFHGKIGIGYVKWLLLLENTVTLFLAFFLARLIEAWGVFFQRNKNWVYFLDFSIATILFRLFTIIRGVFTLDYLKVGRAIYDFPDLCIGICFVGLVFWCIFTMISYRKYKKERLRGMKFMKKMLWELKLSGMFFKVSVLPRERWQAEFEKFRL